MQPADILIGGLAILLGMALLIGAALDGPWLMNLAKARLLAEAIGRPAARSAIAALGIALIVLGIAVARGWRVHWGASRASPEERGHSTFLRKVESPPLFIADPIRLDWRKC